MHIYIHSRKSQTRQKTRADTQGCPLASILTYIQKENDRKISMAACNDKKSLLKRKLVAGDVAELVECSPSMHIMCMQGGTHF